MSLNKKKAFATIDNMKILDEAIKAGKDTSSM
jgi:hypothetical protein